MKKFFYRVSKNETLISISTSLSLPVTTLINLNNLEREVEEGDLLYVEKEDNYFIYTVKPFERVEEIANRFKVSGETLKFLNGNEEFFGGQKIVIPKREF